MWARYIWQFAYVLHMDPNTVGMLKFWDYIGLCYCLDEYEKQEAKRGAQQY
jgi:hypothetical protein